MREVAPFPRSGHIYKGIDHCRFVRVNHYNHWASEASPTLGCSIEISRDIYVGMYVCMSVVCQITWNHVNQTHACSKSVLGRKIRPVTPVLFVSTIRSFSMDRRETFT